MKLSYIWAKVLKKIRGSSVIGSTIHSTSRIESGSHIVNSQFDKHSFCGYDCEIINARIGAFCSIGNNVKIGGSMHPMYWVSTSPAFYAGRDSIKAKFATYIRDTDKTTTIGSDVWIGQDALLKQGVNIGTGAIIGMGSIVTKDVPPYGIVAGNPAKLIRYRFNEQLIVALLESKWWEYSDQKLQEYAQFFTEPEIFIRNQRS